jgi:hypothetical protein
MVTPSRHCTYCGRVGPRVVVLGGYAHRYCIDGPPVKGRIGRPAKSMADRYWPKVDKNGLLIRPDLGRCWGWLSGITNKGYGRLKLPSGKYLGAHVVSWIIHFGKIPDGDNVLHKCDNPICSRPDHLFTGTHRQNMHDRDTKGRGPQGEKNGNAKLTNTDACEIRKLRESGMGYLAIAKKFKVTKPTIYKVCKGMSWASLK